MKGVIIGRLILMALLTVVRWILEPLYFVSLVLLTIFESAVKGLSSLIAHLQTLNNEQLTSKVK